MTVAMAPTNVDPQARALAARDLGDEGSGRWLIVLGIASLGVHAALFSALGRAREGATHVRPRPPTQVTMEVAPPRAPALPKPMPPPEAPRPRGAAQKIKVAASHEPARVAPPRTAEPETPADFSGVTLTNDGDGAAWASAVGNGAAMRGPVGAPGAKVPARAVAPSPPAVAPTVVPLASLSRPPAPPELECWNGTIPRPRAAAVWRAKQS